MRERFWIHGPFVVLLVIGMFLFGDYRTFLGAVFVVTAFELRHQIRADLAARPADRG